MSQAVQTQSRPARTIETFMAEILPAERKTSLIRELPSHIKPAVFERNLANAIMANPDLMKQPAHLVFREVSKAAGLGLYLDPMLGEAYIITSYNYKTKTVEPQLRVGYRGLIKLGRQSGDISMIYSHEVCEFDYIDVDMGADKRLVHKPKLFSDRGDIIGYYAVVKYTDGSFDFEPMDINEIHSIRDRSDGYKAYLEKKIRATPWTTDEVEMSKKTTIRRIAKRIPQSPELAEAIRIEDGADYQGMRDISPPSPPPPPPSLAPAVVTERRLPPAPASQQSQEKAPRQEKQIDTPDQPAEPDAAAIDAMDRTVAEFEEASLAAESEEILDELRDAIIAQCGDFPQAMRNRVQNAYENAAARLAVAAAQPKAKTVELKPVEAAPAEAKEATPPAPPAPPPPPAKSKEPAQEASARTGEKQQTAEKDEELARQRDPGAMVRVLGRQKASKGATRFNIWWGGLSDADQGQLEPISDELREIAQKADAKAEKAEG